MSERYECEDENWEEHFEIGVGSEAERTQHQQLHHLENGEQVDRPLGDPSYVVVWWVGTLFCNEQHDALKQLVPVQSGDPHVQEQTIQHRGRNIGQVVQDQ